jgi:hypothetical protein
MVQIAHSVTRLLDRPTTEYPTCVTIPDPLHQVFYSFHDPCRCPSYHTYHLDTTRQENIIHHTNKDNGKTIKTSRIRIQTKASQLLITTQTNALITWFLNLPLDEYIDNTKTQNLNFKSKTHEK